MFNSQLLVLFLILISLALIGAQKQCGISAGKKRGRRDAGNITDEEPTKYIIGGRQARPGEFPWMARLRIYQNPKSRSFMGCGGVIWNSNFIVTAAHCLLKCENKRVIKAKKVNICVGEHNTDKKDGEKCFNAVGWWPHQKYKACDKKFKNDIAVIKFKQKLKLPKFTKNGYGSMNAACHPNKNTKAKYATLSGWGRYSTRSQQLSKVLKTINLPVWTTAKCRKKWPVDESQICVGGDAGKNSCMGDSGGPIVVYIKNKAYVVGLSSYGPNPCAQKGVPNVFTKVSYFRGWINKMIRSH